MKAGYIGLGRMGRGMALNLLRTQGELVVFDPNPEAVAVLTAAGATAAGSVAELAREVDIVFTSLPGPAQVEQVLLGDDGVSKNLRSYGVVVEMSTNSHAVVLRLAQALSRREQVLLDAPVSGGPEGASAGSLAIWVGGDKSTYDRCLPLLRAMGDKTMHIGPVGTGTVVKLVHNLAANIILVGMAECFSVGVKAGVDPLIMWSALRFGVIGKQTPLQYLAQRFMSGTFEPPGMTLDLSLKDLKLATELGRDLGVPMRLASLTYDETAEAVAVGLAHLDATANTQVQLRRAGVSIAVDPVDLRRAAEANPL